MYCVNSMHGNFQKITWRCDIWHLGWACVIVNSLMYRKISLFQECGDCSGKGGLNIQALCLKNKADDTSEITCATLEENKLIKKTVTNDTLIDELRKWTIKAVTNQYLLWQHIAEEKEYVDLEPVRFVLHCDYAKNWSVTLPQEVQGNYRSNELKFL